MQPIAEELPQIQAPVFGVFRAAGSRDEVEYDNAPVRFKRKDNAGMSFEASPETMNVLGSNPQNLLADLQSHAKMPVSIYYPCDSYDGCLNNLPEILKGPISRKAKILRRNDPRMPKPGLTSHRHLEVFFIYRLSKTVELPPGYEWSFFNGRNHHTLMPPTEWQDTDSLYTAIGCDDIYYVVDPKITALPWQFCGMRIVAGGLLHDKRDTFDDDCYTTALLLDEYATCLDDTDHILDLVEEANRLEYPPLDSLSPHKLEQVLAVLDAIIPIAAGEDDRIASSLFDKVQIILTEHPMSKLTGLQSMRLL